MGHPRTRDPEDVRPQLFACNGPVCCGFDLDRSLRRRPAAPFGYLAKKLGITAKSTSQFWKTAICFCIARYVHGLNI